MWLISLPENSPISACCWEGNYLPVSLAGLLEGRDFFNYRHTVCESVLISASTCPCPRHPSLEMLQLSPLLQPRTVGNFLWFPLSHASRAQLTRLPLASPVTLTFFGPLLSQAIAHFHIGRRTLCPPSLLKSSKFTNTHFAAERIKRAVKAQEKHK